MRYKCLIISFNLQHGEEVDRKRNEMEWKDGGKITISAILIINLHKMVNLMTISLLHNSDTQSSLRLSLSIVHLTHSQYHNNNFRRLLLFLLLARPVIFFLSSVEIRYGISHMLVIPCYFSLSLRLITYNKLLLHFSWCWAQHQRAFLFPKKIYLSNLERNDWIFCLLWLPRGIKIFEQGSGMAKKNLINFLPQSPRAYVRRKFYANFFCVVRNLIILRRFRWHWQGVLIHF